MEEINQPLPFGRRHNDPKRIIVHAMGEYIDSGDQDFTAVDWLRRLELSAHALVTPSGNIIRCRADDQGAYHARGFNRDSLGIEFLVPGVHTYATFLEAMKTNYLTEAQFEAGASLVAEWCASYGITDLQRHSDVSPGRKYDPGEGFPWETFLQAVNATTSCEY